VCVGKADCLRVGNLRNPGSWDRRPGRCRTLTPEPYGGRVADVTVYVCLVPSWDGSSEQSVSRWEMDVRIQT
jgi:hypothetical protein